MANENLRKIVQGDDQKVDVERARRLCREVLADEKSTPAMKKSAREILAALGDDVEETEQDAKRVARAFSGGYSVEKMTREQAAILGGRTR